MKSVLFVMSSHEHLGNTNKSTGCYLPELAIAYSVLCSKVEITFASPKGGMPPLDGIEHLETDYISRDFYENKLYLLENTKPLESLHHEHFDAIYFVGGHGTMWDFNQSAVIASLSQKVYEEGGSLAAVCHGSIALSNVKLSNGHYLIEDKEVTGFSNEEEKALHLETVVPFLVEDELRECGAHFIKSLKWHENIVIDDHIITGQNPASTLGVAQALLEDLCA